jgi:asparagine synthase (glutamine-hydrolysing)
MAGAIRHRGPDDHGFYHDACAHLAHRRLSIVDLSAAGHQPMATAAGNCWIVYNGEVYNHAALRPELERAGCVYRSRSDTETILYAHQQYGEDCVSRLRGMFAFAIWDAANRRLFCVRDRLGIKPFYYYWDGELFAFASEIKALLEHPAISPQFNDALLAEYLAFGYISSQETLFRNIRKLMPGHHLTLEAQPDAEPRIVRYWDVPEPGEDRGGRDEREWIAECRRLFQETVRLRLMSDVPLGVFLSGGVDSSAIASMMTRIVRGGPVKTFSVGYREAPYSELTYARQVAESIGTRHREIVVGKEQFFNALPKLIWHEDEPIAWPSSISLYFVSKLAREDVTVVLTGEGSDELFGGYARYQRYLSNRKALAWYRLLPRPVRASIRRAIAGSDLRAAALRRKLRHTFAGRAESVESLHLDNFYSAFSEDEQAGLLRNPGPAGDAYRNFLQYWDARPGAGLLSRMLYADQKTYLVELLMKQDQMSMANSIESRVPFLDHLLVEFAARVPDVMKLRGTGKYIFKRAVADLLPREIVDRRKMGFPTPMRQWLMDDGARPLIGLLQSPKGLLGEYLQRDALDRLVQRHAAGQEDATDRLWRLINLQIWGDLFFTGERERVLQDPLLFAASPL